MENQPKWHGHLSHSASLPLSFSAQCTPVTVAMTTANCWPMGILAMRVKIIGTCSWGAVCQVGACHQALDGRYTPADLHKISFKLCEVGLSSFLLQWTFGNLACATLTNAPSIMIQNIECAKRCMWGCCLHLLVRHVPTGTIRNEHKKVKKIVVVFGYSVLTRQNNWHTEHKLSTVTGLNIHDLAKDCSQRTSTKTHFTTNNQFCHPNIWPEAAVEHNNRFNLYLLIILCKCRKPKLIWWQNNMDHI